MLKTFVILTTLSLCFYFLSQAITLMGIKFSELVGFFDIPDGQLKLHDTPTPYCGGGVIWASLLLATFALTLVGFVDHQKLLFAATPFFALGLMDDLFDISQGIKFIFQFIFCFSAFAFLGFLSWGFLKILLFLFIVLAVVNAFNLIDIADGLATLVAMTICFCLAFFLLLAGNISFLFGLIVLLGSILLGFLKYNKPPAKIYLGDSGSSFLGAFLAFSALISFESTGMPMFSLALVMIMFFGFPLAEVLNLILIRLRKGRPVYLGSADHFVHYVRKKHVPYRVTLLIAFVATSSLSFLAIGLFFNVFRLLYLIPFLTISFLVWEWVIYVSKVTWPWASR